MFRAYQAAKRVGVAVVLLGLLASASAYGCTSPPAPDDERLTDMERVLVELQEQQAELAALVAHIDKQGARAGAPALTTICDRSIAMQERLLDHYSVPLCRYVTAEELYRLDGLSIGEAEHSRLRPDDFAGMVNLRGLEVRGAEGSDMPAEFFKHLGGLRYLDIQGYSLTSVLDREWSTELPRLEVLELRGYGSNRFAIWFSNAGACWHDYPSGDSEDPDTMRRIEAAFGSLDCAGRLDVGTPQPPRN